ncbi:MAG TPA: hypothetical protein VLH40_03975 [Atribacteraceae bacterium]|nr:hypothetical protein [Atribacteraceae bacterium]
MEIEWKYDIIAVTDSGSIRGGCKKRLQPDTVFAGQSEINIADA